MRQTSVHGSEAGCGGPAPLPSRGASTDGSITCRQTGAVQTRFNEFRGEIGELRERMAHLGRLLEGLRPGSPTHLPGRESPHARPGTPTAPTRRPPRFPALATPRPNALPPTHRKPLRLAAPALLALLAALAAAPAAAQTTITLVSNTGQGDGGTGALSTFDQAQAFTTGANAAGYKLTGVDIDFAAVESGSSYAVSIWTSTSTERPNTSLGTLTGPSTLTADALNAYTTSGIDLAANTIYLVVVDSNSDDASTLQNTASNSEDSGGQSGWSIVNNSLFRNRAQTTSNWASFDDSKKIAVKGYAKTNNAPVFDSATVSRSVAENTAAGQNIGSPVTATDADTGDTLTYTLGGPDVASFGIIAASGQIRTKTGVTYDHEAKDSYSVTVTASDGIETATATVTISVTDVTEPPTAPAAPTVTATTGSTTSLDVTWTAPTNTGKPAIGNYDLQYRQGTSGDFTDGPQDVNGTSATISGLTRNTLYQVQVRATNADGDSPWSASGNGTTNDNTAPTGKPTIDGTPHAGEILTASVSGIADADGLTNPGYTYQWIRVVPFGGGTSNIAGATASTYTLTGDDVTHRVRVRVMFTDDGGTAETVTSDELPVERFRCFPCRARRDWFTATAGDGRVRLRWTNPSNTGGVDGTTLRYQYRYAPGTTVPDGTAWSNAIQFVQQSGTV